MIRLIKKKIFIKFQPTFKVFLSNRFRKEIIHNFIDSTTVKDLIESYEVPHTEVDVILVNKNSVDFNYRIQDGDKIEIFSDYKNSSGKKIIHLKPIYRGKKKFICDVHLGKLVREMRKLGLDVFYNNSINDEEIVKIALREKRIILTRDTGLLKRKEVKFGYFVRNVFPEEQLKEILKKFDLTGQLNPLSLCLECSTKLKRISIRKVKSKLPDHKFDLPQRFYFCIKCDKVYWQGTHFERMMKEVKKYLRKK